MTLIVHQLEALKYVKDHMESEAARHFQIPSATPRTWKGLELQPNNCEKSMNKNCLLVFDSFKTHKTDDVPEALVRANTL